MIASNNAFVHNAGPLDRIPVGEGRTFSVDGEEIAVFRTRAGGVHAVQARCPHRGGPLADGIVGGDRVVCPLHAYAFDLPTGASVRDGCPALRVYRVSVSSAGDLLLSVPSAEAVADG